MDGNPDTSMAQKCSLRNHMPKVPCLSQLCIAALFSEENDGIDSILPLQNTWLKEGLLQKLYSLSIIKMLFAAGVGARKPLTPPPTLHFLIDPLRWLISPEQIGMSLLFILQSK